MKLLKITIKFYATLIFNIFFKIVFFFFITFSSQAGIPWEEFKGINDPLKDSFQHFSPLNGFIYAEKKVTHNYARYFHVGPVSDLSNLLFHQAGMEFHPSGLQDNPATHLHPELIGKIVGVLGKLDIEQKKILQKAEQNKNKKIDTESKIKLIQESTRQELMALLEEDSDWKDKFTSVEILNAKKISGIKKQITSKELRRLVNRFFEFITKSADRPEVYKILTSLLWYKVEKKQDYLDYYRGIYSQEKSFLKFDPEEPKYLRRWMGKKFQADEDSSKDQSFEGQLYYILTNLQKSAALQKFNYSLVNDALFTDCGETTLRNIFKIILNRKGKYDIGIFDRIKEQTKFVSPQLIEFFQNYSTSSVQDFRTTRYAWAKVVSSLNDELDLPEDEVNYLAGTPPICNIAATRDNLLRVLKKLINVSNWQEFSRVITQASERKFHLIEHLDENGFGKIDIETDHEGDFVLNLKNWHYFLETKSPVFDIYGHLDHLWKDPHTRDLLSLLPNNGLKIEFLSRQDKNISSHPLNPLYPMTLANYATDEDIEYLMELQSSPEKEISLSQKAVKNLYGDLTVDEAKARFLAYVPATFTVDYNAEIEKLLANKSLHRSLVRDVFSGSNWKIKPEWIEIIIKEGKADREIAEHILSKPQWKDSPELVEALIKNGKADSEIAQFILSKPHWKDHPEFVEILMKRRKADWALAEHVLNKFHWKEHPEWVELMITEGRADGKLAKFVLNQPHWRNHSDWIDRIILAGKADREIQQHILVKAHWKEYYEIILERQDFTVEDIRNYLNGTVIAIPEQQEDAVNQGTCQIQAIENGNTNGHGNENKLTFKKLRKIIFSTFKRKN